MIKLTEAPICGGAEVCVCLNLLARMVAVCRLVVMMGRALACLALWGSGELVTGGRRLHMRVERMGCMRVVVRGLVDAGAGV